MSAVKPVQRPTVIFASLVLLAWTGFAPATASAQRAQPRVQGGGGSGGGSDRSSGGGGGDRSGGRTTAPREGPRTAARPSAPREAPSTAERSAEPASNDTTTDNAQRTEGASRRARGDSPEVGRAVARRGPPPSSRNRDRYGYWPGYAYSGFYPWGYGGFGLGGYYGSYYGPWYGSGYGYGGGYGYGYDAPYYGWSDDGALRLKVKPREASVFVDGYYVGRVDDFDGVFQRLHLEPGPHRIEVRADDYEPLSFEVRILPDRTVTYEETLKPRP